MDEPEQSQKFVITFPTTMHRALREEAFRRSLDQARHVPMTEVVREAVAELLERRARN